MKEGTIRLLKKVGDQVAVDETIAEIETDKANLSVNAPKAGVIEALLIEDGANIVSGAQVAQIGTGAGGAQPAAATPQPAAAAPTPAAKTESAPAPTTKPTVPTPPSTPQREISSSKIPVTPFKSAPSNVPGIDPYKISGTRSETRVKMSRMRLKIAERLKEAQNTCAMLTTFNEIDMRFAVETGK